MNRFNFNNIRINQKPFLKAFLSINEEILIFLPIKCLKIVFNSNYLVNINLLTIMIIMN